MASILDDISVSSIIVDVFDVVHSDGWIHWPSALRTYHIIMDHGNLDNNNVQRIQRD